MTIAAKRFEFLDQETNVAITDFLSADNSAILSSANLELKTITAAIGEFFGNNNQSPDVKSLLNKFINPTSRRSKDASVNREDTSTLSAKELDRSMSGLAGSVPQTLSLLNQLSSSCKSKASGRKGSGKPYEPAVNCNGKERKTNADGCSANIFGSAVNKITAGQFAFSYQNPKEMLDSITALSTLGYDLNMCGVFGSLIAGNTNRNLLSRASAGILGHLTSTGNTNGIMDLANSSAGLDPLIENPDGISSAISSFTIGKEVKEKDHSDYSDRFMAAMSLLDDNWDKSEHDDIISIKNAEYVPDDLAKVTASKVKQHIYDENNLDIAPNDSFTFMHTALAVKNNHQQLRI